MSLLLLKVGDFVQQWYIRKNILGYFKNPVNSWQVSGNDNLVKVPNLDKVFESSDKKVVRKVGDYEFSSARNYADFENPLDVFVVFMG